MESKKLRIKFSKVGSMKFISHLDLMRYVQKALRRAGIDVAYSKGYSPHQLLSFAAPLGLGDTSEGDYLDLQVNTVQEEKEFLNSINREMNQEIRFLRMDIQKEKQKPSMALVAAADYCINIRCSNKVVPMERFSEFISQKELFITKKTKRSTQQLNILPMIYSMGLTMEEFQQKQKEKKEPICPTQRIFEDHLLPIAYLRLSCGSSCNLKPDLVMEAFCEWLGMESPLFAFQIHRLETYADIAGKEEKRNLVPLWKYQ